jgi:tetratricopeptide (TPR) repeat protein
MRLVFYYAIPLALLLFFQFRIPQETKYDALLVKKKYAYSCSPDRSALRFSYETINSFPVLPGTGTHTWKISTTNDSAQLFFNQGINLYYGFHVIEALGSFKKAQTFDPDCAMLYWAEALALGPNINDLGYTASPDAVKAAQRAETLKSSANAAEQILIDAMNTRYSADTLISRDSLNNVYAAAMKSAFNRLKDNPEVTALYADALLVLHPWNLWQHDGEPRPWTNEIVAVLEHNLKLSPDHPGANHYYIHAVEASPHPERAMASADKLGRITPGVSHMVHMPSHIYIRTGFYNKGITVNQQAVARYKDYLNLFPDVINNSPLYDFHNRHMEVACAMNENNYDTAINSATNCRNSVDKSYLSFEAPIGPFAQNVYMTPVLTMIRFGKWKEILKEPEMPDSLHYAALLQQFARGLAFLHLGQIPEGKAAIAKMDSLISYPDLAVPAGPFNAPKVGATVAINILKGMLAARRNKYDDAVELLNKAIETEDGMVYNEPRDWLLPARQFLGYIQLSNRKFPDAVKTFRDDLKKNPGNANSQTGLSLALNRKMVRL